MTLESQEGYQVVPAMEALDRSVASYVSKHPEQEFLFSPDRIVTCIDSDPDLFEKISPMTRAKLEKMTSFTQLSQVIFRDLVQGKARSDINWGVTLSDNSVTESRRLLQESTQDSDLDDLDREDLLEFFDETVESIRYWLDSPIIIDHQDDHTVRREWRSSMSNVFDVLVDGKYRGPFSAFFERNRVKNNLLASIVSYTGQFTNALGSDLERDVTELKQKQKQIELLSREVKAAADRDEKKHAAEKLEGAVLGYVEELKNVLGKKNQ